MEISEFRARVLGSWRTTVVVSITTTLEVWRSVVGVPSEYLLAVTRRTDGGARSGRFANLPWPIPDQRPGRRVIIEITGCIHNNVTFNYLWSTHLKYHTRTRNPYVYVLCACVPWHGNAKYFRWMDYGLKQGHFCPSKNDVFFFFLSSKLLIFNLFSKFCSYTFATAISDIHFLKMNTISFTIAIILFFPPIRKKLMFNTNIREINLNSWEVFEGK